MERIDLGKNKYVKNYMKTFIKVVFVKKRTKDKLLDLSNYK